MTCTQLFLLLGKFSLIPQSLAHHFTAKTGHHDVAFCSGSLGGINDVLYHGLAGSLVQHLRQFGLHTGSLAGSKDNGY